MRPWQVMGQTGVSTTVWMARQGKGNEGCKLVRRWCCSIHTGNEVSYHVGGSGKFFDYVRILVL